MHTVSKDFFWFFIIPYNAQKFSFHCLFMTGQSLHINIVLNQAILFILMIRKVTMHTASWNCIYQFNLLLLIWRGSPHT